jgi:phosphatidate cytidylyltransferase
MTTFERFFSPQQAFEHRVTIVITAGLLVAQVVAPLVIKFLALRGWISDARQKQLWIRWSSWLVMLPVLIGPILLGAGCTILGVGLLSLLCYREFSRATGLFREKGISLTIVIGIALVTFATLDNWYRLFMALTPLTVTLILAVALFADRPHGYIQRTALGVLGFVLFGHGLGHLGYLANDSDYRPIILLILVAAEVNDIFAYLIGRTLGKVPVCPNTTTRKTVAGVLGGLVFTTLVVYILGLFVFEGTVLTSWHHLVTLGILISVVGQLGDLIFSSIKRDLGIKDFDVTVPGHGGLLDRFDSIIPIAAIVFHYVNYFVGIGSGLPSRFWTTIS